MDKSNYERLAAINVSDKIEKKNNLSYLSWAWAVDQLLRADPTATWTYGEPVHWNETVMVFCTVVAFGKPMTAQLPVMDYKNKAISNPDAFAVNTAMQRCLAKAIALHGLGLYIYAGEDLPEEDKRPHAASGAGTNREAYEKLDTEGKTWIDNLAMEVVKIIEEEGAVKAHVHIREQIGQHDTDDDDPNEWRLALHARLDSKTRAIIDGADSMYHCKSLDSLKSVWQGIPKHAQAFLEDYKDSRKTELTSSIL